MSHYNPPPPDRDPHLWEIAQRRAGFKSHLATYIVVNIFLWEYGTLRINDTIITDFPGRYGQLLVGELEYSFIFWALMFSQGPIA